MFSLATGIQSLPALIYQTIKALPFSISAHTEKEFKYNPCIFAKKLIRILPNR